jgi:hypothetical protein
MVITGVADKVPDRIRRLAYWNALVANNGESLNDMLPPQYVESSKISPTRGVTAPLSCRLQFGGKHLSPTPTWTPHNVHSASLESASHQDLEGQDFR